MKLCKDCKYYQAPELEGQSANCLHPEAVIIDYVDGKDRPGYCEAQRHYGPCYQDAKLFEPKEITNDDTR